MLFETFQVVGEKVLQEFTKVILKVDLMKIDDNDFKKIFHLFETAVDLCPSDPRHRLSTKDLDAVDSYLLEMSKIKASYACRTDDSEMASDFALAVVGACFLLVGREMQATDGLPTPDIIFKEDALPDAEASGAYIFFSIESVPLAFT